MWIIDYTCVRVLVVDAIIDAQTVFIRERLFRGCAFIAYGEVSMLQDSVARDGVSHKPLQTTCLSADR